jgi:hypothetical protein
VHEALLSAVVEIALDPPPGLIGGSNDPGARSGQGAAALGVGDSRCHELRERGEARLDARRQRLPGGRTGDHDAPHLALDDDRRPARVVP